MPEAFHDFVEKHNPEIVKMQDFMSEPLDENPAVLAEQLVEAESYYARAATILAFAKAHLDAAECDNLPPEGKELDRKIAVKKACIPHRRFSDVAEGLCRALGIRISLGQSLLRSREREFQNTMRATK